MCAALAHPIHEKGRLLERGTKLYFERVMPVEAVYYWRDWAHQQGLPIQDTGIDLVAIFEGQPWAIQCKLWQKEVDWSDLGTFVASLTKKDLPFAGGYLVVESLTQLAERQLEQLEKSLRILSAREILNTLRDEYGLSEEAIVQEKPIPPKTPKTLRPYQEKAVRAAVEHFQHHHRGKLLMPPGTGKTLVSLRITEELLAHKIQSPTSPHCGILHQGGKSQLPLFLPLAGGEVSAPLLLQPRRVRRGKVSAPCFLRFCRGSVRSCLLLSSLMVGRLSSPLLRLWCFFCVRLLRFWTRV
jgi:predicted helicase